MKILQLCKVVFSLSTFIMLKLCSDAVVQTLSKHGGDIKA